MRTRQNVLLILLLTATILPLSLQCETCTSPTQKALLDITHYVAAKNHLIKTNSLILKKSAQANEACFWQLTFETPQKRTIVLYLSPDRRFLSNELFDTALDPLIEEKKDAAEATHAMLAGDPPSIGPDNAPVTLVEFSDFECPYCQRLKNVLEKEVLPKANGQVRVIIRNYPLPMHPWAKQAAVLASCASLQDKSEYWKIFDFLFDNQKSITTDNVQTQVIDFVANNTSLNKGQFQKCVDLDLSLGMVTKDMDMGQLFGVHGTPTAFINGVKYEGAQNAADLLAIIQRGGKVEATSVSLQSTQREVASRDLQNQCNRPQPASSDGKR